jgi:RNA polymerase sigma-70 factor (ECF subfamily)
MLAEELLADTFERALRARRRFDPRKSSRKTWLYTIALNLLRDRMRRQAAESRALERAGAGLPEVPAGDPFEQVERRDQITRAMERLSEEEREAVALRYGAGLTVPEIAGLTGESLTTAEGRVYRALRKLRDEIG